MKQPARLIIPLWGEVYAQKLVSIMLPAVLAPGNLPALAEAFDVEVVIVTETRLFARIRQARSFQLVSSLCRTRLVALDDLMTELPGDYGIVLTYALYRGFTDLGARMTQTFLLFLNADFIICDGALRHLARLMLEGRQVIHAPSFRVVLEDVWPQLHARVDPSSSVLSLPAREMVRLALAHKHVTVKARTVNQRLCHQIWMDQFYWYVDEDTLIGYQWPVALVALKPERAVSEPPLVWDYAFIPEACPTAPRHFIADSDDFFMLEPQKRASGEELVRLGWTTPDAIAADLSKWTTKEQRESGRQLLTIHAGDVPANVGAVVAESRAFMAEVTSRLSPRPQPHIGHGHLGAWFETARYRMRSARALSSSRPQEPITAASPRAAAVPAGPRNAALAALRSVYRTTFGSPPEVGRFHPLWLDTAYVVERVAGWKSNAARILWLTSRDSLFHTVLHDRIDTAALFLDEGGGTPFARAPYDACLCELAGDELTRLSLVYSRIRPFMRDGGEVVFLLSGTRDRLRAVGETDLCQTAFPGIDVSEIRFFGSAASRFLRGCYLAASNSFHARPLYRAVATAAVLTVLAPLVRLANARAARRDASIFTPHWSSAVVRFLVGRSAPPPARACAAGEDTREAQPLSG